MDHDHSHMATPHPQLQHTVQQLYNILFSSSSSPPHSLTHSPTDSPMASLTHLDDLPDVLLSNILSSITDTRTRNSFSLVSHKWHKLERSTRTSLTLRGNVRNIFMTPTCFTSVTDLDLSFLSPWGHALFPDTSHNSHILAEFLQLAFPSVTSLTIYSGTPSTLAVLAPQWPSLQQVKLIRWHQRYQCPLGSDFIPLFENCTQGGSLHSLDLSTFYCWTEDLPAALHAHPSVAAFLTSLNILTVPSAEGFKSHELIAISAACPNLGEFLIACMFDPRYIDFVGDEAVTALATNCPKLYRLHLVDTWALSNGRADPDEVGFTSEDARISLVTLDELFTKLPLLQDLVLDVCHNVRDAGVLLETLNTKCTKLKSLKLGQFHGICRTMGSNIDGVAVCKGLESLCIKNSADLSDANLMVIALGCPRLKKFHIEGCKEITEIGMKNLAFVLRKTLIDVKISCCKYLDTGSALRAMGPIQNRIQRLDIECLPCLGEPVDTLLVHNGTDLYEFDKEENMVNPSTATKRSAKDSYDTSTNKKCKYSSELQSSGISHRSWDCLQYLSIWIAVGDVLTPLDLMGFEICPVLEEFQIKIEGDCRTVSRPTEQSFGLICLAGYPHLSKMKIDCSDAIGYALTAPSGQMDLSLWDRFYLNGIGHLNLKELDYWPPQDRDVNQRGLSLPAAGLISECTTLRKLFIHGTAHEHFMMMLLKIPNLRDMQLREDYYPAPEDDMCTEMRVTSCSRFEDALNRRAIPD